MLLDTGHASLPADVDQIGVLFHFVEQQLFDLGQNFLRNFLATVPGAATPFPYGGKVRQIQVDLDLPKLQAYGLAPTDIVNAVNAQNVILPSGTAKIGPTEYNVGLNGAPVSIEELNNMPVKSVNGATVYIHDVAHVRDGYAVATVHGRRTGRKCQRRTARRRHAASGDARRGRARGTGSLVRAVGG